MQDIALAKAKVQVVRHIYYLFSEFVQVLGGKHFISWAASGFHAEAFRCESESVESSDGEENNTCAKRRGGRAYEM